MIFSRFLWYIPATSLTVFICSFSIHVSISRLKTSWEWIHVSFTLRFSEFSVGLRTQRCPVCWIELTCNLHYQGFMKETALELSLLRLTQNRGRLHEAWRVHSWPCISIALREYWVQWTASDLLVFARSKCFLLTQIIRESAPWSWEAWPCVLYPWRIPPGGSFSLRKDFWVSAYVSARAAKGKRVVFGFPDPSHLNSLGLATAGGHEYSRGEQWFVFTSTKGQRRGQIQLAHSVTWSSRSQDCLSMPTRLWEPVSHRTQDLAGHSCTCNIIVPLSNSKCP